MKGIHRISKVSVGEFICPRKSGPLPSVIGFMTCLSMNQQNPVPCDEINCKNHISAKKQSEEPWHVESAALRNINNELPSEAEDDEPDAI